MLDIDTQRQLLTVSVGPPRSISLKLNHISAELYGATHDRCFTATSVRALVRQSFASTSLRPRFATANTSQGVSYQPRSQRLYDQGCVRFESAIPGNNNHFVDVLLNAAARSAAPPASLPTEQAPFTPSSSRNHGEPVPEAVAPDADAAPLCAACSRRYPLSGIAGRVADAQGSANAVRTDESVDIDLSTLCFGALLATQGRWRLVGAHAAATGRGASRRSNAPEQIHRLRSPSRHGSTRRVLAKARGRPPNSAISASDTSNVTAGLAKPRWRFTA